MSASVNVGAFSNLGKRGIGALFGSSALFYVAFFLLYVKTMVSEIAVVSLPELIDDGALLLSILCFVLFCILRMRKFGSAAWLLGVFFAFFILNYFLTGLTNQLTAFLFIVAASFGVGKRRFVSIWFKTTAPLFAIMVVVYFVLFVLGSDLATFVVRSFDEDGAVRLSFFFNHPNGAATVAMMLVGAMMYLASTSSLRVRHYALVLFAFLFILYTTDSKTSAVLTISLIPLYLMYQKTTFYDKPWVRGFIAVLPALLFCVTFLFMAPLYSVEVAGLFTGRVWLWHTTFVSSGITVFGHMFEPSTAMSFYGDWIAVANTLDSFYAVGLLTLGLVVCVLFCWAVFRSVLLARGDEVAFLPLIIVLLLHGFTESGVLAVAISFPLIFLSVSLASGKERVSLVDGGCDGHLSR